MISKLRFTTGIIVFAVGQLTTLLIPFVTSSALSEEWKTVLSSILFFVTPQIGIFLAIAILGKPGYEKLKAAVFGWIKKQARNSIFIWAGVLLLSSAIGFFAPFDKFRL